ncbi:hypothetical protein I3842_04G116700 [Carya illinoinensis]|uniref:Glabrous enhancer-binding protein-like DBD domain-containing protein n=1 Tax=Carya illinoinensis TaxID=32201 RepID=A0A922JUN7_CARIL|nr:hypothetical protein I3842_04G116700 [Carya illinoinensis]KAG6717759.1 hypothetical protein I3842_04G116700 [Carya illinoinensis]
MASKRLKEDPPPASTSGEDEESDEDAISDEEVEENEKSEDEQGEEDDEDDDDGEDEEEEEEKSPARKPSVNPSSSSKVVSKPQTSSGSETESGSASESERSPATPSVSGFTIKPIASKPMGELPKPKKPNNNSNNQSTAIAISGSSSKRAAENDPSNTKNPKKRKVSSSSATNGDDEDSKKPPGTLQRLWSEEDELAVLKGMIEYESKKGSDSYADMGALHEFLKRKLHVEVSKAQLMEKIRRMKKKYRTNFEKGGEDMVFSKPHEHKAFELSKKIWGNVANNKNEPSSNQKGKANNGTPVALALPKQEVAAGGKEGLANGETKVDEKRENFGTNFPCLNAALEMMAGTGCLGFGKGYTREFMVGIGNSKAMELESKGRKVREAELEAYVKKTEFYHELSKLKLEIMKKRA